MITNGSLQAWIGVHVFAVCLHSDSKRPQTITRSDGKYERATTQGTCKHFVWKMELKSKYTWMRKKILKFLHIREFFKVKENAYNKNMKNRFSRCFYTKINILYVHSQGLLKVSPMKYQMHDFFPSTSHVV